MEKYLSKLTCNITPHSSFFKQVLIFISLFGAKFSFSPEKNGDYLRYTAKPAGGITISVIPSL